MAAGALTRAADMDIASEFAGGFTFIEEGTANADTGWVCSTDNPVTVGTTPISFVQFSSAGIILAGNGLQKIGNIISVLPDSVTEGFATVAATTNGTRVIGLPSQYQIAGSAVSSNVTAANMGTLVDGVAQDAAALHSHSKSVNSLVAGEQINAGQAVYVSSAGRVSKADRGADASSWVVGIASTSAMMAGGAVQVVRDGVVTGILSGATAGTPYYLGTSGALSASLPAGAGRLIMVGVALNSTDLFVQIRDYGKRA